MANDSFLNLSPFSLLCMLSKLPVTATQPRVW